MSDERIEEETYSLIFKTLRHPIRRKILRILLDKPLSFSEILDILSMDSGHLNYHIENLGELLKHSPEGKYELSSIGKAAVSLMSGVEERPQLLTMTRKSRNRKVLKVLLGVVLVILAVSTVMSAFFYVTSQDLTKRIQATTGKTAMEFNFNLNYVTIVLGSEVTPENINGLIRYFNFYVQSGWGNIRTLRTYLIPPYIDSLLPIDELMQNLTTTGIEGVGNTLNTLASRTNRTTAVEAFKELNREASGKLSAIGSELANAFEYDVTTSGSDNSLIAVSNFRIVSSRIDNAIQLTNDLTGILDEWVIKYAQT